MPGPTLAPKKEAQEKRELKFFAVNAISKQHAFTHLLIFSEWVKFLLKIIGLVFGAKSQNYSVSFLQKTKRSRLYSVNLIYDAITENSDYE